MVLDVLVQVFVSFDLVQGLFVMVVGYSQRSLCILGLSLVVLL